MNDLIKELEQQSYDTVKFDDTRTAKVFNNTTFAKLIVQECLKQCYNRGMDDELYAGQLKAAAYIEEHFGVK